MGSEVAKLLVLAQKLDSKGAGVSEVEGVVVGEVAVEVMEATDNE
jgi:hypothetical protein